MKHLPLVLLAALWLVGCQSPPAETESSATTNQPASSTQVKEGMSMDEVQNLLGEPKEVRHEHAMGQAHGSGDEIDIWVYDDKEIRFINGKVDL